MKEKVLSEFDDFANVLRSKKITVTVVDDTTDPIKPDAVFPNNWISFHEDGKVILYPMLALSRRHERRRDIIETLKTSFFISEVIDLSFYEEQNMFLEGTGSIVFDHDKKIAYACISSRTNKELFTTMCEMLAYKPLYFTAVDEAATPIYHTNVMMCIGSGFCVICLESIVDEKERKTVASSLINSGHQIVDITYRQMNKFAGNMLALKTATNNDILVLSKSAFDVLTTRQRSTLESYSELVPLSIPTIESVGGGSVRCMIAEIFLQPLLS